MKIFKYILVIILFLSQSSWLWAQSSEFKTQGTVIDATTKERLAFVNIIINEDGTLGTTSDIDGNYSISTNKKINTLTFSFVGYENKTIEINNENNIIVKLKPTTYRLSDVIIDGNNDPANRIIDSVFKYRDDNNPKNLDSYYYKIYDNMVFTMDTSLLVSDDIRRKFKDNDMLAMETISEQFYQKPNKSKKNILANKFSGSKNPMSIYMIESLQSIGFYEDLISINEKKYVNPISKGSKKKYIFCLESAFKNENNDSIFTISFVPYRNTNFNSLKGIITVNSDNWAIQNIKASPNKQNEFFNIEIQQLYEKVDGHWFPKQLNTIMATYDRSNVKRNSVASDSSGYVTMSLGGEMSSNLPLLGIGKSYLTEIKINEEISKKTFGNANFTISDNAGDADDLIRIYRYDTLSSERLEATYHFIDSIFNESDVDIDKISNALSGLMSNQIPVGFINLNFNDFMDYNIGNGYMLGLGLSTNNKLSNFISAGGFGNYWFKANEFNYGGHLDFKIVKSKDMRLKIGASHQFERFGNYGFEERESVLNPSNYKHFYTNATTLNNSVFADFSTYFNKYIKGIVTFEVAEKSIPKTQSSYRLSTIDFKLRIAFGEMFIKTKDGLKVEGSVNPVIWLSYQKNLKDVFGSPYDFDKFEFLFRGKVSSRYFGETALTAQLGYINGEAPLTESFNLEGSNAERFGIYCTESFSTMRPDEFLSDKFAALYFSHNFKNLLIDFKKFHPEIIIVTNVAWGGFQDFRVSGEGYYESGLVIDNIIKSGFSKIGLGVFYRYGPNSYEKTFDNFVFKICLGFSL